MFDMYGVWYGKGLGCWLMRVVRLGERCEMCECVLSLSLSFGLVSCLAMSSFGDIPLDCPVGLVSLHMVQ